MKDTDIRWLRGTHPAPPILPRLPRTEPGYPPEPDYPPEPEPSPFKAVSPPAPRQPPKTVLTPEEAEERRLALQAPGDSALQKRVAELEEIVARLASDLSTLRSP